MNDEKVFGTKSFSVGRTAQRGGNVSDEELIDLAHTILLRLAMRGGHDAYTGALLHKWLKAHESRPTKRAPDACPYCAGKGEFVNVIGKALRCNHCAGTGQRR